MKAKKLKQDFFIIIVSSFIVVVLWIGFSIYSAAVSSTIDETLAAQLIPIVPSFDLTTVEKLKQRKQIAPLYEVSGSAVIEPEITPTPTSILTPTIPEEEEFIEEEFSDDFFEEETIATDEGEFVE